MARRNRTSSPSAGSRFASSRASAPAPRASSSPAPASQQSGSGSFVGNIVGGIANGLGFTMAMRAVDSVAGPREVTMVHRAEGQMPEQMSSQASLRSAPQSAQCQLQQDQLNQCLTQVQDMTMCNFFFENLKQCKQSAAV